MKYFCSALGEVIQAQRDENGQTGGKTGLFSGCGSGRVIKGDLPSGLRLRGAWTFGRSSGNEDEDDEDGG